MAVFFYSNPPQAHNFTRLPLTRELSSECETEGENFLSDVIYHTSRNVGAQFHAHHHLTITPDFQFSTLNSPIPPCKSLHYIL